MFKKFFFVFLSFGLLLFLFPVVSLAETSGDFEYTVSGNEATIIDYTGTKTDVAIPANIGNNNEYAVTSIGNGAFSSKGLTSVTIPNSVTTISNGAFTKNKLKQLVLPNSVQSIGINSFSVNQLEQITFSTSLTNIPRFAFFANKLKSVNLPTNIANIDEQAFENNYITDITIQNPNIQLDYMAFAAQTVLGNLVVRSDNILPLDNYIHFNDASSQLTMDNLTVTDLSSGISYDSTKNALIFSAEPSSSTFSLYTGTNRYDSYYDISEYGPSGIPIIFFEYTKPIIVNYKDSSGLELATSTRIDGSIGESYSSTPKIIDGYTLKETSGNPTGQFTNTTQTINYIYEKTPVQNGTVIVKYQDEFGTSLAKDTILTGVVGTTYQTESKDIPGYTLKKVDGHESGVYTTDPETVTYIYEKISNDGTNSNKHGGQTSHATDTQKVVSTSVKESNHTLPSTGDTNNHVLFAIGSFLVALATGTLFFKRHD